MTRFAVVGMSAWLHGVIIAVIHMIVAGHDFILSSRQFQSCGFERTVCPFSDTVLSLTQKQSF
jgi:hypothetical protein